MRLILLILFVSISFSSHSELPEWMKRHSVVDRFVWSSTEPFDANNVDKIRSYSKLIHEDQAEYTDFYHGPEAGAKSYVFHFTGLKVHGFYIPGKRFFLKLVEVTTPEFVLDGGIRIGSSVQDLLKHFEFPGKKEENKITYIGQTENVVFTLNNGVIKKIELYRYTG